MNMPKKAPKTIDEYLLTIPEDTRAKLVKIKKLIQKEAPKAEEAMTYGVPSFKLNGNLVNYAAFKNHIGLYASPSTLKHFKKELAGYKQAGSTIRFPLDEPIPYELIKKIVRFRVKENKK